MINPTLNPAILLAPVESGYVAYDPVRDRLHHLNPIAALIAELCDGTRTRDAIEALVAPLLSEGAEGEIERWLDLAAREHLVIEGTDGEPAPRELTAPELSRLAERLRSHGKVQTAFLCRQRAVELAPDDAEAWCQFGDIAHIAGRRADARIAYERYLEMRPDDAEIRHIVSALRDEPPPPRVPDSCILQLYQRFSAFYESNMVDELGYEGPERLEEVLGPELGDASGLDILELGCGSGLAGVLLRPRAATLTGIDLSPEMIGLAQARNLYDRLDVAEITDWLARAGSEAARYDLVVACDTMIYFGDLAPVARAVAAILKPGGRFVFTVERGDRAPFRLSDSGRYMHHPAHMETTAEASGLSLTRLKEGFLRSEYGVEVTGLCAALRKQG
jgi:predicted TPR repeat methyltransferase